MQKLTGFLKLIRAGNLFIIALSLSLFYYLIIVPVHYNILQTIFIPFPIPLFILFVLSVILIAAGGNIINDYFDFELDKEFKPRRPLAMGLISLDAAMYWHMFFILTGIAIGFYLGRHFGNFHIGYLYIITAVVLYIYSAYLKKMPLAGNLVIAALTGFVFVLLVIFESGFLKLIHAPEYGKNFTYAFAVIILQMKFYAGFAFLTSLARELVKDIEDREGDAAYKIDTFAVQFGNNPAKWLTVLVLALLLGALGFYMYGFYTAGAFKDMGYLGAAVALPVVMAMALIIMAKQQKDYARVSSLLKLIMLLGILSIPAFYFFHQNAA